MFQNAITAVILANICLLAAESYDMTPEFALAIRCV